MKMTRWTIVISFAALLLTGCSETSEEWRLYGNVDIREVELGFRVAGRLAEMRFEEGDEVEAGTLLASIDAEPYREALVLAEARVAQATAEVEKLESGARPQEIEQARSRVEEAGAQEAEAQRDYERQRGLVESGAKSEKELDRARTRAEEAAARLAAAREALALAEAGFRDEEIAAARAALAAVRAEREQVATRLADAELHAPSPGVIQVRVHEPGVMLQAGTPVYVLTLPDPVYVRAYVAEPDLGRVAPGDEVWVSTDSSEKRYRGQNGFISPRAEFTPKTVQTEDLRTDLVYRLRIVVEDGGGELRQGMPVTVHMSGGHMSGGHMSGEPTSDGA